MHEGNYPDPGILPLPDHIACDQGVKCPVSAGDKNTFISSLYMAPDLDTVNIPFCFNFPLFDSYFDIVKDAVL